MMLVTIVVAVVAIIVLFKGYLLDCRWNAVAAVAVVYLVIMIRVVVSLFHGAPHLHVGRIGTIHLSG